MHRLNPVSSSLVTQSGSLSLSLLRSRNLLLHLSFAYNAQMLICHRLGTENSRVTYATTTKRFIHPAQAASMQLIAFVVSVQH